MKKIFAILCGVTMMFAACTTPEGGEGVEPIFPQAVTAEVLAGDMYTLTFDANTAWTVSLENDYYAQLSYNNGEGTVFDTEVSGVAGEGIKVRVIVNEEIKNYDADVVIPVSITMGSTTQTLATLTVKQIERPAAIVINEIFETVTFAEGHPSYSEFHNAQKQYSLNYSDKWDLEGVSMTCNLEGDYAIKVHACNEGKQLVDVTSDYYGGAEPWVSVETFGTGGGFKVVMDLSKESAEWSWWDTQYEAYVNFEDAEGNILVSLFCSCTYKEGQSGNEEVNVSFVNPDMAPQADMVLTGSGNEYTLTLYSPMSLSDSMAPYCGLVLKDARQAFFQNEGEGCLSLVQYEDAGYWHIQALSDPTQFTVRNYLIQVMTYSWETININVVLDWIVEPVYPLTFINNYYAGVLGMNLTGEGVNWTLSIGDYNALYSIYADYALFSIDGVESVVLSGNDENIVLKEYTVDGGTYYHIEVTDDESFDPTAVVNDEFTMTATLADGTVYNITVYLPFVKEFNNSGIGGQEPLKK